MAGPGSEYRIFIMGFIFAMAQYSDLKLPLDTWASLARFPLEELKLMSLEFQQRLSGKPLAIEPKEWIKWADSVSKLLHSSNL